MLLKSSSTPVLGSLLSETTPNKHSESAITHYSPSHSHYKRLPFASLNPTPPSLVSCTSSPISLTTDFSDHNRRGFRRAQSEGNLNTLAHVSDAADTHEDPFSFDSYKRNKLTRRPKHSLLQTIPSFAFCNSRGRTEEDDDDNADVEEETDETWAKNTPEETTVKTSAVTDSKMMGIILTQETTYKDENQQEREFISQEMYLARGLGIDGAGGVSGGHSGGGGGYFSSGDFSGEEHGMEEHYKKMMVENPGNPLVLRNYAQFLYKAKGDLQGAEEYYSRAILIDSADGEVLSQYAKLVWELHHDQLRASAYHERAVQASPQDSHVHASYANFLWETEDDADESCSIAGAGMPPLFDQTYTAAATA